jgi:hypothetical protein
VTSTRSRTWQKRTRRPDAPASMRGPEDDCTPGGSPAVLVRPKPCSNGSSSDEPRCDPGATSPGDDDSRWQAGPEPRASVPIPDRRVTSGDERYGERAMPRPVSSMPPTARRRRWSRVEHAAFGVDVLGHDVGDVILRDQRLRWGRTPRSRSGRRGRHPAPPTPRRRPVPGRRGRLRASTRTDARYDITRQYRDT